MPSRSRLIFALTVVLIALALGIGALSLMRPPLFNPGKALIGGPFTLTDQTGQRVSERDFAGRYMLVIFGYTFCPDVCPGEMQVVSAALDQLGAQAAQVHPVFVTVDPERDTPEVMKIFVENFHPGFSGLTGSPAEIAVMLKAYRVAARKIENAKRPADYLMEHTALIYLIGPDGGYVTHFDYGTDAAKLAGEIKAALAR